MTDVLFYGLQELTKPRVQPLIKRGVKAGLDSSLLLTSGQLTSKSEGYRERHFLSQGLLLTRIKFWSIFCQTRVMRPYLI